MKVEPGNTISKKHKNNPIIPDSSRQLGTLWLNTKMQVQEKTSKLNSNEQVVSYSTVG